MSKAAKKKQKAFAMPPEIEYLLRNGHLMASEAIENGWKPMRCGTCQTHNLDLIYRHGAIDLEAYTKSGETLPGTVWGEDVTPICICCSFDHCTHKTKSAEVA